MVLATGAARDLCGSPPPTRRRRPPPPSPRLRWSPPDPCRLARGNKSLGSPSGARRGCWAYSAPISFSYSFMYCAILAEGEKGPISILVLLSCSFSSSSSSTTTSSSEYNGDVAAEFHRVLDLSTSGSLLLCGELHFLSIPRGVFLVLAPPLPPLRSPSSSRAPPVVFFRFFCGSGSWGCWERGAMAAAAAAMAMGSGIRMVPAYRLITPFGLQRNPHGT